MHLGDRARDQLLLLGPTFYICQAQYEGFNASKSLLSSGANPVSYEARLQPEILPVQHLL